MSINEDNGNIGLTDRFKRTYHPQASGVREPTIKGITSSFMKLPKSTERTTEHNLQKAKSIQSIILKIPRKL